MVGQIVLWMTRYSPVQIMWRIISAWSLLMINTCDNWHECQLMCAPSKHTDEGKKSKKTFDSYQQEVALAKIAL